MGGGGNIYPSPEGGDFLIICRYISQDKRRTTLHGRKEERPYHFADGDTNVLSKLLNKDNLQILL